MPYVIQAIVQGQIEVYTPDRPGYVAISQEDPLRADKPDLIMLRMEDVDQLIRALQLAKEEAERDFVEFGEIAANPKQPED